MTALRLLLVDVVEQVFDEVLRLDLAVGLVECLGCLVGELFLYSIQLGSKATVELNLGLKSVG